MRRVVIGVLLVAISVAVPTASAAQRGRARDFGLRPGVLEPGPLNAITDVDGVRVGQVTLHEGAAIHTGVTAVLPHGGNVFRDKVPAAVFVANGFGKLTGITQVQELGTLETPILLTGTLSVPRAADALLTWVLGLPGNEEVRSVNFVVGETNDGRLSDIRQRPILPEHVDAALRTATAGIVEEGSVGAGAGTVAFGFKGGIGTASRRLSAVRGGWTIGALVQTNFGGVLQIDGAPVGTELRRLDAAAGVDGDADGSCMIIIATDAPLEARELERLALRGFMGMTRTGAAGSNGSGDYVIAFSTAPGLRRGVEGSARPRSAPLHDDDLSPLFYAAIEAAEEAIYNSLFAATAVTGPSGTVEALPLDATLEILRRYGRLQ